MTQRRRELEGGRARAWPELHRSPAPLARGPLRCPPRPEARHPATCDARQASGPVPWARTGGETVFGKGMTLLFGNGMKLLFGNGCTGRVWQGAVAPGCASPRGCVPGGTGPRSGGTPSREGGKAPPQLGSHLRLSVTATVN